LLKKNEPISLKEEKNKDLSMYYDIIGIAGVSSYLMSYLLLQFGKCDAQKGYTYTLLNIAGAVLVLISLKNSYNMPSAVSQIVWIVLSFYGLLRVNSARKTARHNNSRAEIIYNPEVLGQTDEVYIDGRLAWSRTDHRH
jgi:TRAP-type uncharacterized transport system fused permease subunit